MAASENVRIIMILVGHLFWIAAIYFIRIKLNSKFSKEHFYLIYLVLPCVIPLGLFVINQIIDKNYISDMVNNNYSMFLYLIFTTANLMYSSSICFLYIKKNDELRI